MSHVILIVEDSEQCAVTLEFALMSIPDLTINRFSSGEDALRFLDGVDRATVSAVITDLNMPVMDGFELISRIRSDQRYATLPIMVLSGDPDPRAPARTRELGANAFFPKPFSPTQVKQKLEALLDRPDR